MDQKCELCGSETFVFEAGSKICIVCGTEDEGFLELKAEIGDADADRSFFFMDMSQIQDAGHQDTEDSSSNWTSYELFNLVLHGWTKALINLGASEQFQTTMFDVWKLYLQRSQVAFIPEKDPLEIVERDEPKGQTFTDERNSPLLYKRDSFAAISVEGIQQRKKSKYKRKSLLRKLEDKYDKHKLRTKGKERNAGGVAVDLSQSLIVMDNLSMLEDCKSTLSEEDFAKTPSYGNSPLPLSDDDQKAQSSTDNVKEQNGNSKEKGAKKKLKHQRHTGLRIKFDDLNDVGASKPMALTPPLLLSLLYTAVLLGKEKILLLDIVRWCREGSIPYVSVAYLLKPEMRVFAYDLLKLHAFQYVPTAEKLRKITQRLAIYLNLIYLPLPDVEYVTTRLVTMLNLPEQLGSLAYRLQKTRFVSPYPKNQELPSVECAAMSAIIFLMKAYVGLDGHREVCLSAAAKAINKDLKENIYVSPLFSWENWERYMSCLLWFCAHVDPVSAKNYEKFEDQIAVQPSQFMKFFWSEGVWRLPRLVHHSQSKSFYPLIEKVMDESGQRLEDLLQQPPLVTKTQHPFLDIVKQFVNKNSDDFSPENHKLVKIGKDLLETSFTNHRVDWPSHIDELQESLRNWGSKIEVISAENVRDDSERDPQSCKLKTQAIKRNRNREQKNKFVIPQMSASVGIGCDTLFLRGKHCQKDLSDRLQWLIKVGSLVCETSDNDIMLHLGDLERLAMKSNCNRTTNPKCYRFFRVKCSRGKQSHKNKNKM